VEPSEATPVCQLRVQGRSTRAVQDKSMVGAAWLAMSVTPLTEPSPTCTGDVHAWQRCAWWRTHCTRSPARSGAGHRPHGARMSAWLRRACRRGSAGVRGAAPARDGAADRPACGSPSTSVPALQREGCIGMGGIGPPACHCFLPHVVQPRGWRGSGTPVCRASHGFKGSKGLKTNRFFVFGTCPWRYGSHRTRIVTLLDIAPHLPQEARVSR